MSERREFFLTQIALISAHWRGIVERMGYERELTVASQPFLFDPLRSSIAAHLRSLFAGEMLANSRTNPGSGR